MISGRQALATVEQTISTARNQEARLYTALHEATAEAVRLRAARTAAFRELAKLKLDALGRDGVLGELDAAERRALAIMDQSRRAEMDARTARIKADLRLTPEQEKNWPGLESAVRDISKNRADRLVAFRVERAQRKESDDVIAYLKSTAKYLGERSADVK